MCRLFRVLINYIFIITPLFFYSCSSARISSPILWNKENLKILKTEAGYIDNPSIKNLISSCDKYIEEPPIAVTDKTVSFAPDLHYYCSVGPYWWQDSISGKYIRKDGYVNPDYYQYDATHLEKMESRCRDLGVAFYLTGDIKYYHAFEKQLRTWFVDPKTYMYPNFEYAQVVPGQNGNKGRCYGIIEAYSFNNIIESIRLVNSVKPLDQQILNRLKSWFNNFAQWMDYGVFGAQLKQTDNNIGVAYDVILVNMYLFVDNKQRATEICEDFSENRIYTQINDKGEQPKELERTRAFSYSVFNLGNIVDFIQLSKQCNPDVQEAITERTAKAFDYLSQYVGHKEKFPYKEISNWDACERSYNKQMRRFRQQKGEVENSKTILKSSDINTILYY